MFFLTWSGPAPVLFSIPIRVWGGSRRKVQLRRCGLKTVGRSCQGLHFRGRKQSVPELPVSCVCFTQVKPRSYAGALWAKQVPCRKHSALWGQDRRSKWVQPREPALAGYRSCSIPSPGISPVPCSARAWSRADTLPQTHSALKCHSPMPAGEEDGKRCLPVMGDSWEGLVSLNEEASFLLAGLLLLLWQFQLDMENPAQLQTLRHCFRTRPVRRNEAFWW